MSLPFRYTNAPVEETYSFNSVSPCRQSAARNASTLDGSYHSCPLRAYCDGYSGLIPLFRVFGADFKVTLAEPSSSLIIRSEHQYRYRDLLRRTVRKHLYELEGEWAKREWLLSRSHLTPIQDELKKFIRPKGLTAQCVDSIIQAITAVLDELLSIVVFAELWIRRQVVGFRQQKHVLG